MTNMLILNQSYIDLLASVLILFIGVFPVSSSTMNPDSVYDQFVCRVWFTRAPLWATLLSSAANTVVLTLERYIAIVHPVTYKVFHSY